MEASTSEMASANMTVDRPASGTRVEASWSGVLSPAEAHGLLIDWFQGIPVPPLEKLRRKVDLAAKRAIDVLLAVLALSFLAPLLLTVALVVKFSTPGPIFFRQTRIGFGGRPFTIYKFRSMYSDRCDSPGSLQATLGDERVTRIGRFLRRTSVDELPQLLNVLYGDMSLVGPRPYVPEMLAGGRLYNQMPHFAFRHLMKPGVTGWAQAWGLRGPTDDEAVARTRLVHDVAYVQHFSLLLDIRIILMTLRREFISGSGV